MNKKKLKSIVIENNEELTHIDDSNKLIKYIIDNPENIKSIIIENCENFSSLSGMPEEFTNKEAIFLLSLPGLHNLEYFPQSLPKNKVIAINNTSVYDLINERFKYMKGEFPMYLPNNEILYFMNNSRPGYEGIIDITTNMPKNKIINIEKNSISYILNLPESLPNNEELKIKNNDIFEIKNFTKHLPKNIILDMSNNKLINLNLPDSLPNNEHLNLSKNNLSSLIGISKNLPKNKILDISNNRIRNFIGSPEILPNTEIINMDNNPLINFIGFPKVPKLKSLNIKSDFFHSFEGIPKDMTSLEELIIQSSNLNSLKYITQNLPSLRKIEIENTPLKNLENFPNNVKNLQELIINKTELNKGLLGLPDKMEFLKYIDISENKLINLNGFPKKHSLKDINISHNYIKKLDDLYITDHTITLNLNDLKLKNFKGIQVIEKKDNDEKNEVIIDHLNSRNNNINSLEGLEKINKISYVFDLSYNDVTSINSLLPNSELTDIKIHKMDLQHNLISTFYELDKLKNTQEIDLRYNKITNFEGAENSEILNNKNLHMSKWGEFFNNRIEFSNNPIKNLKGLSRNNYIAILSEVIKNNSINTNYPYLDQKTPEIIKYGMKKCYNEFMTKIKNIKKYNNDFSKIPIGVACNTLIKKVNQM